MKKIFSIILVTALALAICAPFAVSAEPKSLSIPKAATAPTLDGVINADEWKGALVVEMKNGDASISVPGGDAAGLPNTVFQFMWAPEGIYFSAVSTGNNEPCAVPETGNGSYNQGNGIQFNFFTTRESATVVGEIFFFSYHPAASDGKPCVGEHFVYGTGGAGEDVPEAKIGVVMNGNDYSMEGLIPSASLVKSDIPINVASGAKLIWNNIVMFTDGSGAQGLASDAGWVDAAESNEYTLTNTLAGVIPPVAAKNPFARITATEDNVAGGPNGSHETKENPDALYDPSKTFQLYWDTDSETWAHGGVNTIAFLAPYGIGYGHKFGTQYIENLDFGANGADKVTVALTYPEGDFAGLGIYLDANPVKDKNAKPIATITGVQTDGFEEDSAKDYTVDVNIPGGVHTLYFMYLGGEVGSFFSVVFNEAPAAPVAETPAEVPADVPAAAGDPPAAAATPEAPVTGDAAMATFAALALAVAIGFAIIRKKRNNLA